MARFKYMVLAVTVLVLAGCGQKPPVQKAQQQSGQPSAWDKHNANMSKAADDFAKLEPWKKNNAADNKK